MHQQGFTRRKKMKVKMKSRIILDGILLLTFIALILVQRASVAAHIVLVILFFIQLAIHCRINWRRIRFSIHKAKVARLAIYLALLSFFFMAVCSGLVLSELFFGQLGSTGAAHWHHMHGLSTRLMLLAVVVHVVSNRKVLAAFFAKRKQPA